MPGYSELGIASDAITEGLARAFMALRQLGINCREIYSDILLQTLNAHVELLSVWTVWEPDALDGRDQAFSDAPGHDKSGRFTACWHRARGEPVLVPVADYENPERGHWYWTPKKHLVSCKLAPIDYYYGSEKVRISGEITPLIEEGRFYGAVGIDFEAPSTPSPKVPLYSSNHQPSQTTPIHASRLDELSPREHEVFYWMEQGKTNEEIGIILGISHHTVKHHLEKIFQKLGVNNRREAAFSAQ